MKVLFCIPHCFSSFGVASPILPIRLSLSMPRWQHDMVKISEASPEAIRMKPTSTAQSHSNGNEARRSLGCSHLKEAHQGLCFPNIRAPRSISILWGGGSSEHFNYFLYFPAVGYSGRHGPNVVPSERVCVCVLVHV